MSGQGGDQQDDSFSTGLGGGAKIPDLSLGSQIQLGTVGAAYNLNVQNKPDYLDYDQKGRGVVVTMFANTGASYLIGTMLGGVYGLQQGLQNTPSSRFKVKLNSVLNQTGRHGSRFGNVAGVLAIMYSLYEGAFDSIQFDRYTNNMISYETSTAIVPALATFATGATFKATAGPRVAALAGTIGLGMVGTTYAVYSLLGMPPGAKGFLFL